MKTNILLTSSFFWLTGFVYSNTYVWEDYDDFSGSSLDTSKWGTITFNGGIEPYHQNGSLMLSSNAQDLNAIPQNDAEWDEFVADLKQWGDPEVFAYIKDSSIHGVQASFSMPNGSADGTFVDLSFYEVDSSGQEATMTGIGIGLSQENGITKIKIETEGVVFNANPIAANISQTYTFSITNIGDTCEIFLDGVKVDEISLVNFQPNLISLSAYNENQQGYNIETDNVRVLREATTTSLDGSIFTLSSTDGVSETMSFENGTFTSSFVDSQKITTITSNQSYILDSMSSNNRKITLSDGDVYSFDSSAGTGTLTDYENGVMDTSGSWNFTYTRNTWMDYDDFSDNSLDTTKWEVGYWAGGETVTIVNGQAQLSGSAYSSSSPSQMPSDFANAGQDATGGNTFLGIKDATIIGLEADIMIPNTGNQNEAGIYLSTTDSNPLGSLGFELLKTATGSSFNYDYFNDQGSKILGYEAGSLDTFHKIKMTELNGQTSYYLDNKLIKQFASTSHDSDYWGIGSFSDNGMSYTTYADNVRVLRNWEDYDDFTATSINSGNWNLGYWDGGNAPTIGNGKITLSGNNVSGFNSVLPAVGMLTYNAGIKAELEKSFASTNGTESHSFVELANNDISAIAVEVTLPFDADSSTAIGLYASDWTKAFSDNLSDKSFFGLDLWSDHIDVEYVDPNTGSLVSSSISTQAGSSHVFSFIFDTSMVSMHVDGEKVAEFSSSNFSRDSILIRAMNEAGKPFTAFMDNVRVLRRSTTTTQPDPVTVVSDPNGQAVVVQAGSEYQWNSALDGVTLWMVHEDDDDGWFGATIQYVSSMQQGSIGLTDQVGSNLVVNHPYVIDENGMIKVTEDTAFQYYQVTAVENGVIITADGSSFPLSDTSRFFTTRAAAEEYYYSKVNPKDWMWFDHYPWVYSNEMQEWLYFYPSGSKLLYYSNKNQAWREFSQ